MVAQACNPNYLGGGNRRIMVWIDLGQKCEDPTWNKLKHKSSVSMAQGPEFKSVPMPLKAKMKIEGKKKKKENWVTKKED
jgi:hypothetical protein